MNEIKCPNCGEVFTVNESQYAELLSQVRKTKKSRNCRVKSKTLIQKKNWLRKR